MLIRSRMTMLAATTAVVVGGGTTAASASAQAPPGAPAPVVDVSALLAPGAITNPASVSESLMNDLLRRGDLGDLQDLTRLGRVEGRGTGSPGLRAPTREYELPATAGVVPVLPESIAYDERSKTYFVASSGDGAVYRGTLDGDRADVFLPGLQLDRPLAFGIETDDRGHLYVLSPVPGQVQVYDIASKRRIATFETGAGGLLNDLVVTPGGDVYVTDSLRPTLFRITREQVDAGRGTVEALPLGPEVQYTATAQINGVFNGGGIVATAENELIVSQINRDKLFRIRTRPDSDQVDVRPIRITGKRFGTPDGMELDGNRLYALDNLGQRLMTLRLNTKRTGAKVLLRTADRTFRTPTGIASTGGRLLVSNSQLFRIPMLPPYTVSNIRIPSDD
jgi:Cu-Zn family superoxide dismutase